MLWFDGQFLSWGVYFSIDIGLLCWTLLFQAYFLLLGYSPMKACLQKWHEWPVMNSQSSFDKYDWSVAVVELQKVSHDLSTTIGQPRLVNHDWSTTICQPRLVNHDWSTTIGQPRLVNHDWSTTIGQPRLVTHICSVTVVQLLFFINAWPVNLRNNN